MNVNHLRSAYILLLTWYLHRADFDKVFADEVSKIPADEIDAYTSLVTEMIHKTAKAIKDNQ